MLYANPTVFSSKTSSSNNSKRTNTVYVNILTHLIFSLHPLYYALIKKYATNPKADRTKMPKPI